MKFSVHLNRRIFVMIKLNPFRNNPGSAPVPRRRQSMLTVFHLLKGLVFFFVLVVFINELQHERCLMSWIDDLWASKDLMFFFFFFFFWRVRMMVWYGPFCLHIGIVNINILFSNK